MTVFLQSLGSRVVKAVTKPISVLLMMRTLGPILPLRSLMQMLRHAMSYFKLWTMTILLGSSITNPPTRFGHT